MRFQIPQFIEVEDKIFGPLTLKQFIYLAGGAGMSIIAYLFLPFIIAILVILPVIGLSIMLAFYKINNKPIIQVIEYAFNYMINPKLYIWHHEQKQITAAKGESATEDPTSAFIPKLSDSKLKDLSWTLDTKEALNPVTKGNLTNTGETEK